MDSLRSAMRLLRRSPVFAAVTVCILAAGIAANTAMFSIVSGVLLRPLPFAVPEQLVTVGEARSGVVGDGLVSLPVYLAWRERQSAVAIAGYAQGTAVLTGDDPMQVTSASVSANFFPMLGEPLQVGRQFLPEEDAFGAPRVLILGHALWRARFGGDAAVIGSSLTIEGQTYTVVGVARPGFDFPSGAQLWTQLLPSIPRDYTRVPTYKFMRVVGRLAAGATVERARVQLSVIAADVPRNSGWAARVTSLRDDIVGDVEPPLLILMAAVGLVLLITCANVGNLLLTRGASRARQLAIRAALGASRARITRELLAESLLLASLAGGIGTLAAWWTLDVLLRLSPTELPRLANIGLDIRVLGFSVGASLFTGLAAGAFPAFHSTPLDLARALNDAGHVGSSPARGRLRSTLVTAEISLSLVLLVGAGLLIRSFIAIASVDPGFLPAQVTVFELSPARAKYSTWSAWQGFFTEFTTRVRAMPGVEAVATASNLPMSDASAPIVVEHIAANAANRSAQISAVSPEYFRTMQIPLLAGRDFESRDETGTIPVAVVNEQFARTFFPGENPIGKKTRPFFGGPTMNEIIGVVGDVHQTSLTSKPDPVLYTLAAAKASGGLTILVRSNVPPERLVPALRSLLRGVDPDQPMLSVTTMRQVMSRSVARQRFYATLLGGFAIAAVSLAMLGLYAVMAQLVAQRRREMAVRVALGARGVDVFQMLLGQGMRLVLTGLALGVVGAMAATRLLSNLLFGVGATDIPTFIGVNALVVVVAAGAISIQAWRAARLDPMRVLGDR